MSLHEDMLEFQLKAVKKWDGFEREVKFDPERKWRFDLAHRPSMLAVEIDGGQWIRGRHNRPGGFENDARKLNRAAILGWTCMRFTPRQVNSGEALETIETWLKYFGEEAV
jgi:very-short-patch-repair endonuclease